MLSAISNSGPLIHLNEIGQIKLLNLFTKLTVPNSVLKETGKINLKNIIIMQVSSKETENFVGQIKKFKLQRAETDALFLAKKFSYIFLTDDLEARTAANELNIKVHGSIGVIALACKKELINLERAKQLMIELYNKSSLFLTKSIVDLAINELEMGNKIKNIG